MGHNNSYLESIGWDCQNQKEDVTGSNRLKCNHSDTDRTLWVEESGEVIVGDKNVSTDITRKIDEDAVNNRISIKTESLGESKPSQIQDSKTREHFSNRDA